ncbi:MAG TPA: MEMO1 family protein, partial [Deltaproteobacteria bacterium]|nr:MEMO1 family protein [Deltaproteobacteria bacterium]
RVLGGEAGRVLVVAGVDFSHVGRKFGHDRGAAELVNRARAHDRDILECLGNRDAAGILRLSRQARDWSHVCGLPALVLFATILSVPTKAELLCHETYDEPATQSAVTYAAMVFHRS